MQRYVKEATHRQKEVFMPLEFEPGQEAQVDWHEGWILENGVERKCPFFVMKLCYSKAMFVHPCEKAEFPMVKELSSYRFADVPKLNQKYILDLALCQSIESTTNLVISGPPGPARRTWRLPSAARLVSEPTR